MPIALRPLPVLALLAWAAPLAAQEAPEAPAEEPAAEAPAETPAPEAAPEAAPEGEAAPGIDMGQPAEAGEAAVGQEYVRETVGDWSIVCVKQAEGPEPCQLGQLLLDDNDNPVAEIRLAPLPPGEQAAALAIITAPLMTLLTEGIALSVDGGEATRYNFFTCTERGCIARIGLSEETIAAFKRGNEATVSVVPAAAPDQTVSVDISLSGFTEAFDTRTVPAPDAAEPAASEASE